MRRPNIFIGLLLATVTLAVATPVQNSTKPQVTRISLHVARSLDPSETELLNVRAKNGEVATLIVKKREGRKTMPTIKDTPAKMEKIQDAPNLMRAAKSNVLPNPVNIRSDAMFVKDEATSDAKKKGRKMTLDEDGVPVIEGVREPDSAEDKVQTWRNARVINGVLVPYKQSLTSEIPLKKTKPEKQEVVVSSYFETNDKKSSMFGDDDIVKTQWKGIAETITQKPLEKVKPIPLNYARPDETQEKIIEYIMKINQKELRNRQKSGRSIDYSDFDGASRRMDENVDENEEPIWVNTQPKEIWTEDGKISVADRRNDETEGKVDKVTNSQPEKQENKFLPIAPFEPRLLHPQGVSNYPSSSMYSSQPSRLSFEDGVRTPVLQYAHPELGAQQAKIRADSEDAETSRSDGSQASMPSLTYFSNDPYADRSPYAYEPGLGSQTEDTLTSNSNFHAQDVSNSLGVSQERENGRRHSSIHNIEFTTSASEAHSINPDEIDITESPNRLKGPGYISDSYRDTYGLGSDKYIKRYPYSNYHGSNYPMTKEEYYKWKMSGMSYPNNYNNGYYVKIPDNRPFWEKITESIKETVQSGVESMKDLTRPVMEPLVEATQRISQNLGINEATAKISNTLGFNQGTGMRTALQEKVGAAAASSPVLLPALGLVAGGAALGLGAVAMGRLLDVNVHLLKRSENGEAETDDFKMEHKRALEAARKLPEKLTTLENGQTVLVLPIVEHINSNEREGKKLNNAEDAILLTDEMVFAKPEGETVVLVPVDKAGKSLPVDQTQPEADKEGKNEFKRLIDESGIEGLEKFHFNVNENDDDHKSRRRSLGAYQTLRRRRRAPFNLEQENEEYLDNILRNGETNQEALLAKMATLGHPNAWSSTPCAKKIFCDVMVRQSHDAVLLMEKKMATFLSLIHPPAAEDVSQHLQQVMAAVKLQDCSQFICHRGR